MHNQTRVLTLPYEKMYSTEAAQSTYFSFVDYWLCRQSTTPPLERENTVAVPAAATIATIALLWGARLQQAQGPLPTNTTEPNLPKMELYHFWRS
jgi:hypothetical protein